MTHDAEPDPIDPHAHAAALRRQIVETVTAAIRATVAQYVVDHPAQPWRLDVRPTAPDLTLCVDLALDDLLELVLVRAVDGVLASFPTRSALG
jgi:hypothetical protein